jgi:hypothetical protein
VHTFSKAQLFHSHKFIPSPQKVWVNVQQDLCTSYILFSWRHDFDELGQILSNLRELITALVADTSPDILQPDIAKASWAKESGSKSTARLQPTCDGSQSDLFRFCKVHKHRTFHAQATPTNNSPAINHYRINNSSNSTVPAVLDNLSWLQFAISRRQGQRVRCVQHLSMPGIRVRLAIFIARAPLVHSQGVGHDNGLLQLGPARAWAWFLALAPAKIW